MRLRMSSTSRSASVVVAWWRGAALSDRVTGVVLLVVVVPGQVWATVTFQRGWVAWVFSAVMVFGLLWFLFALRQVRRSLAAREVVPPPPEDVRAVMADGREIPLECRYLGWRNGRHCWVAVYTLSGMPVNVKARMLPACTEVRLWVERP